MNLNESMKEMLEVAFLPSKEERTRLPELVKALHECLDNRSRNEGASMLVGHMTALMERLLSVPDDHEWTRAERDGLEEVRLVALKLAHIAEEARP